jgi:hypothetical protein
MIMLEEEKTFDPDNLIKDWTLEDSFFILLITYCHIISLLKMEKQSEVLKKKKLKLHFQRDIV